MAALSAQEINFAGVAPAFVAADAAGDTFPNDGKTFLYIRNAGGAPRTVTIDSKQLSNFLKDNDEVIVIPSTGERMVGPYNPNRFNNNANRTEVSYDDVTGLTIAVLKLGNTP